MALEDTAVRLIAKFGRDASILIKGSAADTPAEPWDGAVSEGVPETVKAVFLDFNANQIDGTVIQAGDQRVLVAAKGNPAIDTADTILDGDKRWRIVAANLLKPGTVEYLWTLQVRA